MGIMDILQRYSEPRPNYPHAEIEGDFERAAQEAPEDLMEEGLVEAFRAEQTPPFEQMVGQLYERSAPQERAGLLDQLIGGLGPGALGALTGGGLAEMLRRRNGDTPQAVRPDETDHVDSREIERIAQHAERENPNIVERVSRFYAQHPQLVRNLGSVAMSIAMSRMARRGIRH